MDGWMDGEVLIIGKVVGWSGWVPKGLNSGGGCQLPWSFFFQLFFEDDFFRCFSMLGRFWEVLGGQNGGQNPFSGRFFSMLFSNAFLGGFGRRFGRVFGRFFGHVFNVLRTHNCKLPKCS